MTIPPLLVPFAGASICAVLGYVEVHAFGLAVLPVVYVLSFLLGAATGVWWFSRQ